MNVRPAQNIRYLSFVALILENNTRCPRIQVTLWAWQSLLQYPEVLFLIQQRRCTPPLPQTPLVQPSDSNKGFHKEAQELHPTVDIKTRSRDHIL